jgi:hypothetical protein
MIRNRWAALAAMMCSLAAQGFALAQQTATPDVPTPRPAVIGTIVKEDPTQPRTAGFIVIQTADGKTQRLELPLNAEGNSIELHASDVESIELPSLPKFVIGVSLSEVPDSLRAHLSLAEGNGIMVGAVVPDSPAAKAGLQQYDLLLKSGDRDLKVAKDLQEIVDSSEGKAVSVSVQRKGQPLTIELTPIKREDLQFPQNGEFSLPVAGEEAFLMPNGDDPATWLELMKSSRNLGAPVGLKRPTIGAPVPQMKSLTDSIQKLTDQIERLQQAVDRLEQRQGVEKPAAPPEEKKVNENGGAMRFRRENLISFLDPAAASQPLSIVE